MELESSVDGQVLLTTIAKTISLEFVGKQPQVFSRQDQLQENIEPIIIGLELVALNWTTTKPGIYEGRPKGQVGGPLWVGSIKADRIDLTNIGVPSPNHLRNVSCDFAPTESNHPSILKVETDAGVLLYSSK